MTMVSGAVQAVQQFLADGGDSPSDVDPTTGKGPEWGEAAPVGLLVIVLLCVAVYFLVKSMNRNIKKVPKSFDVESALVGVNVGADGTAVGAANPTDGAASAAGRAGGTKGSPGGTAGEDPASRTDPPAPSSTP